MPFSETGAGPLYLQLHRRIAEAIESGKLKPGDSLPAERDMASDDRAKPGHGPQGGRGAGGLGNSWCSGAGSGTYVAAKVERLEQALSLLTSFTEDMARRGPHGGIVVLSRSI
jgi:GntR family transcriptional regulator